MSALARRQPPGYGQISVAQIRKADEEAFTIMAKHTCKGIKKVDGKRPMDASVDTIMAHRDFNLALQPLPGRGHAEAAQGYAKKERQEPAAKKQKQQDQQNQWQQPPPRKGEGKCKGKGEDKSNKGDKGRMPSQLKVSGAAPTDPEGNPICFSYNMDGCSAAPPGGRCPKGRHVCILTRCNQAAHAHGAEHR